MFGLVVVVIIVVVIIVVLRKNKRNKAIEALKNSSGYEVAKDILDELLAQEGFEIDYEMSTYFMTYGAVGNFYIKKGTTSSPSGTHWVGNITIATNTNDLMSAEHSLQTDNIKAQNGYIYAIQNNNIGLLVRSDFESQEIPPFLEIAASVIINSGYKFEHPKWINEASKAKKYLNVMFQ